MSVLDWFRRKPKQEAAPAIQANATGNALTPMDLERLIGILNREGMTASGAHVTTQRAEGVAAVGTCVRILSNTMGHLPLVVFKITKNRREPEVSSTLYSLLHDQPNEWQTAMEFRAMLQRHFELRGNGYARKVFGLGREVVELLPLHPDQVHPKQDERGVVTYEYSRPNGSRVIFRREEIFHLRGLSDDGLVGKSPITVHRETIGDALAMQEHGSRFFSNGAKPLSVVTQTQAVNMSIESKDNFKADLQESYSGSQNAHKSIVLPFGYDLKTVSISMEDAQYIEGRKFNRSEIFGMFGVPPHKGGDLEKATFSNIEHQALEFVSDAIAPRCVLWEQAIKRDLLNGDPKRYAKHNLNALLRGDAKSRAEALQIQRRNGVINANEWRDLEDFNPRTDPGGETYIVEANMTIDDGKLEPKPSQPAQPEKEPENAE